MSARNQKLISSIYEAIGEDGAVPHVMGEFSRHIGASVAFWYVIRKGASGDARISPFLFDGALGVTSQTLNEFRDEMWRHDYALRAASVADRTTETHELISKAELATNDYAQWIERSAGVNRRIGRSTELGGGVVAGWALHMAPGVKRKERERRDFDLLAPHIRTLFRLTSKFGDLALQREGLAHIIDAQGVAVILLAADRRICWASQAAENILKRDDGLGAKDGRVMFTKPDELREYETVTQRLLGADPVGGEAEGHLLVTRPFGAVPYVVEIAPAPAHFRRQVHGSAAVILTIHDPDGRTDPRPEIWRKMFGLTPMEARVAMLTMRGLTDGAIAEQLGIGIGTVRSHQKQLLAKTETNSKAEVAHLLTRLN